MQVITFYSYKGGVGRTLACANFGLYLAKTGQKVVLADMDFEAPGLDSKFPNVELSEASGGLLDQFVSFQNGLEIPDLEAVEITLPEDVARSGGRLKLMPAGNYLSSDYYEKLSGLHWETLLAQETGLAFCIDLVKRIEETFAPDVLVIDSRTGLTEIGGLCTQVFPDTVILLTCTSKESLRGTRRIYERISNSRIVKNRLGGRTEVEVRVVIARIPRPDNLPDFESAVRQRLDIPAERLFYLFDQGDLSRQEYLALDRFEEHPAILDDYVELFASFNPETTLPYVKERLTVFRSQAPGRTAQENDRILKELLTLFPRPEVMLVAARYYRQAKDGDAPAVANYIRYLDCRQDDAEILVEFADLCASVPEGMLRPQEKIALHLRTFGVERMGPVMLARFSKLCSQEDRQDIVSAIEKDVAKMADGDVRGTYFRTLYSLGEWDRIVANATERELRSKLLGLLVAEAFAHVGRPNETLQILRGYSPEDSDEALGVLRVIFELFPDGDLDTVLRVIPEGDFNDAFRFLLQRPVGLRSPGRSRLSLENVGFAKWLESLSRQYRRREE